MIRLVFKSLQKSEQDILDDLQSRVNAEGNFSARAAKAQSLWDTKGGSKGKAAFMVLRDTLFDMCVFTGLCNYCEQSEANDIEHIYPKSFYPAYAFNWENYILACKQCNSGHKLDKVYIIDPRDELLELVRGNEPTHPRIAFINPRMEDPKNFMLLNPLTFKFEVFNYISKQDQKKGEGTLKILELNERDTLLAARRSAAIHYYEMLDRLNRLQASSTKNELEALLTPYDSRFDMNKTLEELKSDIFNSFKKYISTYQHPSVWETIKLVQSKMDTKWIRMFEQIPDALNW